MGVNETNPCCKLYDVIVKQVEEESSASQEYERTAAALRAIGAEPSLVDLMKGIAAEEFSHHVILEGILSILNEECHCAREAK